MRGLRFGSGMAAMIGASALALGVGSFPVAARSNFGGGLAVLPSAPPRIVRKNGDGKREKIGTARAREAGKRQDPFFGIRSRGRRGAQERADLTPAAQRKIGRRDRDNPTAPAGIVFKSDKRQAEFVALLAIGWSRNRALKIARRVAA